jgi:hypothetical protein
MQATSLCREHHVTAWRETSLTTHAPTCCDHAVSAPNPLGNCAIPTCKETRKCRFHCIVVLLIGAPSTWGYSRYWGYRTTGAIGFTLPIILVPWLLGVFR